MGNGKKGNEKVKNIQQQNLTATTKKTFPSTADGRAIIKNVRTQTDVKVKSQLTSRKIPQHHKLSSFHTVFLTVQRLEVFHHCYGSFYHTPQVHSTCLHFVSFLKLNAVYTFIA